MELNVSQNGLHMVFAVTDDQRVVLKEFSVPGAGCGQRTTLNWSAVTDVQLTGKNPDDHHGGKHTGTSGSFSLRYREHRYYENELGRKLEFLLCDDAVCVTAHYQFYRGIAAVRAWTQVENCSDAPIGLEYVSSFAYTGLENDTPYVYIPHSSWYCELGWKKYTLSQLGFDRVSGFTMKRIALHNTGSWSSKEHLPMGAVSDRGSTLLWQIEHNGSWNWELGDIAQMLYLKLSGPSEQENGWYKALRPGEVFESAKVCLTVGADFDGALAEMTKYRRVLFRNNRPNSALPVIFNDYMNCLMGDPTTEKLLPIIDRAAQMGAEYFCVDCGWYADGPWWGTVGAWQPCSWRFPNGIREVFDRIREKGMIPGIWLEIEVMGINCPILDDFDDSCFFMRHGKRIIDHGRYQLDFRSQRVRQFAFDVVERVVRTYGVGYIKFDYNIDTGVGTERDADSFGDGLLQHNRAFLGWVDEIKSRYPELILENCASGGMRMDYAQLEKFHLQSVSDQTDYRHTAILAANAATAVLPEQAAVWAYPVAGGDEHSAAFNMVNAMLGRIHLSGDVLHLSPQQFADVKAGVDCYKALRGSLASATAFYPLGLNAYGAHWACVGYRTDGGTYLAVWRLDAQEDTLFVPIPEAADARVVYPQNGGASFCASGGGVRVTLPAPYSAVIAQIC